MLNRWHACLSNGGSKAVGSSHCADTHHCPSDLPFLFALLSEPWFVGKSIHARSNPILEMSPLSEVSLLSVYPGGFVACSSNDGRDFTGLV